MAYSVQWQKGVGQGVESSHALQDISEMVWSESGTQVDMSSPSVDPVLGLFLSLCRLCMMEKVFVSAGMTDVLSPQLASTLVWGLSQVAHPYLYLEEDAYDQVRWNSLHLEYCITNSASLKHPHPHTE